MKFGLREIANVVFKAKSPMTLGNTAFSAGMPVIYFDSAKTSGLDSGTTTVYAQGGRGNSKLIAWEGEKEVTFKFTDALISPIGLAILTGAGLTTKAAGEKFYVHRTQIVVSNGTACSLAAKDPETAMDYVVSTDSNHPAYLMPLDSNGEIKGAPVAATITTLAITTGESAVPTAGTYLVDYYIEATIDVSQIDITPDCFGGYFYIEASTLVRREKDGKDLPAEFTVPKAKIQSAFSIEMANTGDPSTFDFVCDAFPDYLVGTSDKKVLASIQIIGDSNEDFTSSDEAIGATDEDVDEYPYV